MHIIGIDPGLTGAIVMLPEGLFFDTPVGQVKKGGKKVYLIAEMVSIIRGFGGYGPGVQPTGEAHIFIEDVHAMPGNGAVPSFSFGRGYGLWEGIVAALGIPYTPVRPERWKRAMMSGMSKEKDASRVRAMQLYPQLAGELTLKKHHGRADALLIAAYGQRQQGGE